MTTALSLLVLVVGVGAALDLARAVLVRQKLSQTALLVCQYANRASVTNLDSAANAGAAYIANVMQYVPTALQMERFSGTQSNAAPFVYTEGSAANVQLATSSSTTIMQIMNVTQIPLTAKAHCFDSPPATPAPTPPAKPIAGQEVVSEGFESSACSGTCFEFYAPGAAAGATISAPSSSFPTAATYTGSSGAKWYVMGYCLEDDFSTLLFSSADQGTHSAELDCDNGSGTAGNSSISTQTYLYAGAYELRWSYQARVDYPDYNPAYICGNEASDLSWANDTNSLGGPVANAFRTNQVNVYLDYVANASSAPPTHLTLDASEQLAGSNLVDMCIYSPRWIQRSVKITVSQAGWYWLSFAADGQNDSYGGSIDNIMLCATACSGAVTDNFPPAWTAGAVLFQDTFKKPTYASAALFNLEVGDGATGATMAGWPNAPASLWTVAPVNQVTQVKSTEQLVQLDTGSAGNQSMARPFLLTPGYYQVSYDYESGAISPQYLYSGLCGGTPSTADAPFFISVTGTVSGTDQTTGLTKNFAAATTDFMALFMSHAQLASNPLAASYQAQAQYLNPDGTTTATPKSPANSINVSSYTASTTVALLDFCAYSYTRTSRPVNIKITKTAYYWLTFAALGLADGSGGWIGNVKLTALGSPYMTTTPSSPVTVPVPTPQPGSSIALPATLSDFTIVEASFAP